MKHLLPIIFCLSFLNTFAQNDSAATKYHGKTFIRLSFLAPEISIEREINPKLSVLGGFGTGYYIRRRNQYPYINYNDGQITGAFHSYDEPVLRYNYPARLKVEEPESDELVIQGPEIHELKPYVSLESRYYLTLARRKKLLKSVINRSANYVSIGGAFYFDGLQVYKINYGIQRNKNIFWIDWSGGLAYSFGELESSIFINALLKIGLKLHKF